MPFTTYIIHSQSLDGYYIGHCENIEERLFRHNKGNGSTYTKKAKDWKLRWKRESDTRAEAMSYERDIKKKKSRKYIEFLISTSSKN